jgi:hypothetical protein
MENSNVLVVAPSVTLSVANLSESRTKLVAGIGKVGDLIKSYSVALCQAFNLTDNQGNVTTPWYELKGKLKTGVNTERANFVRDMVNAGYVKEGTTDKPSATVDTYWGRIKAESGHVPSGHRATGGTDTDSKTVAELKTMINRIFKSEESGEDCDASEVKGDLMDIYARLGGDIDKLG